jgi:L-alanine-DL-glutamate epimerase-like enolase superfamily enzyme
MPAIRLTLRAESWPIAGAFVIARGSKTEALVVVAELTDGVHRGRGEAVPYARYGETIAGVMAAMEGVRGELEVGAGRGALQSLLPPGAARNALDCALWDLDAKRAGVRAWTLAGLPPPRAVTTAYTLSLDTPEAMAAAAGKAAGYPLLKLKIGGAHDLERVAAVRAAAPAAGLIVDANEALTLQSLTALAPALADLGVRLIEQPLPAGADGALEDYRGPVRLCADESLHSRTELAVCARRYGAVNIKLDKAGGLTEALALAAEARDLGLEIMVGCMVATSLSMAPALLLAQGAAVADLDGALLLARDREPGLAYDRATIFPPAPELWG